MLTQEPLGDGLVALERINHLARELRALRAGQLRRGVVFVDDHVHAESVLCELKTLALRPLNVHGHFVGVGGERLALGLLDGNALNGAVGGLCGCLVASCLHGLRCCCGRKGCPHRRRRRRRVNHHVHALGDTGEDLFGAHLAVADEPQDRTRERATVGCGD